MNDLMISLKTVYAICLRVTFNGRENPDCLSINLTTGEAEFLNRGVNGEGLPPGEPERLWLKGEIQLGLIYLPGGRSAREIIDEMRLCILWDAMSNEERAERMKRSPRDPSPLPRDAEAREALEKLFANYLAGLKVD